MERPSNEKEAYGQEFEKDVHHDGIDMTNRKDSIAFQEAAELYGTAGDAESSLERFIARRCLD